MPDTDLMTMPPAGINPAAETEEQRKRRLAATMPPAGLPPQASSRGFYGAAMDSANRDSAPRETDKSDSREFLQRVMTSLRPQAGSALPANAVGAGSPSGDPSRSTMPPASVRGGRLLTASAAANIPLRREPPPEASSSAGSAQAMPPANLASSERSQPFSPTSGIVQPGISGQPPRVEAGTMLPATFDTVGLKPHDIAPVQNTMPPANYAQRYEELAGKEPTREQFPAEKLPLWKKIVGALAATAGGFGRHDDTSFELANKVFGSPQAKAEKKFGQQHDIWQRGLEAIQKESGLQNTASEMRLRGAQARKDEAEAKNLENPENATDKKIDEYTNDKGQRVLTFQRADNSTYDKVGGRVQEKQAGHTTPFEAFAYGSPDEKKSAQEFLDLEHRLGGRYRTPSEFEEKYRLFKQDPESYRAMFGDKTASGPDRATATKMLNYFDRRRREANQDFTLDDQQKQEQLEGIEKLEEPFLDAVQPGANRGSGAAGGADDRVEVVHPNGQRGTIPRSQLDKAKKKGYRVAQ